VWPQQVDSIPFQEFSRCDLVHCYRRLDRLGDLHALSEAGVAISFDNDDDLAAIDTVKTGRIEEYRFYKGVFREILKASRLADLTTTPSELLAERYRSAGASDVVVIGNHLERGLAGFGSRAKHKGVVIGWVAGLEHTVELKRIPFIPALKRLLETHSDLRILTVGVRLPLSSERYEHIPQVNFQDLLKTVGQMDIGLAPLSDTPFNRSRSNVKLKEYGACGVPWLASPVGPYLGLGEREGGLLVDDEDWFAALDGLVRNSRMRKRLSKRALRWGKGQTINHYAKVWEREFDAAINRANERSTSSAAPIGVGAQSK
jgi:glycosyltransferase involved in cell wall biosynthesis